MRRSTASRAIVLVLAACGPGKASTTDTTSATSTADSDATTATSTRPTTGDPDECIDISSTTLSETGGPGDPDEPLACPPIAGLPCTAPIDCTNETCGSHVSAFDEQGCPRRPCALADDCEPGEGCLLQQDIGPPLHAASCTGAVDACDCSATAELLVGVCVPEALLPANISAHCDSLKTASACARFDIPGEPHYCRWFPTRRACGDSCATTEGGAACIGFDYVGEGCAGASCDEPGLGYARLRPGGSELFFNPSCGDEPHGWVQCIFGDEAPACCVCGQD